MAVPVGQRNVPDTPSNQICYAVDACVELALHTTMICKNRNIFIPEYPETYTIAVDLALNAMMEVKRANRINVGTSHKLKTERLEHQQNAIDMLSDLDDWIYYCKRRLHLRVSKDGCWHDKTNYALNLVKRWHSADELRYRNI